MGLASGLMMFSLTSLHEGTPGGVGIVVVVVVAVVVVVVVAVAFAVEVVVVAFAFAVVVVAVVAAIIFTVLEAAAPSLALTFALLPTLNALMSIGPQRSQKYCSGTADRRTPTHRACCHTKQRSHWIVKPSSSSSPQMQRMKPESAVVLVLLLLLFLLLLLLMIVEEEVERGGTGRAQHKDGMQEGKCAVIVINE